MGLVDKIKNDVKKSGQNRGKFIYFREGEKRRIRFLQDMDDGMEVTFHDSFKAGVNVPCQEAFGRSCEYCDDEELRTRSLYLWSVWDYESKQVMVFMFPVNNCSPIPALMAMYENYGTITDRDYVINVQGKQTEKTYSVVPMDKAKFRNEKAKAFSNSAVLKMIDKAYPADDSGDYSDKHEKADDNWDEDGEGKYDDMSAKELYGLCVERDIEAEKKKPAKYYINLLEEDDKAHSDWDDDDNGSDDDWDDEGDWEDE